MQGMGILDPVGPRALFVILFKYVGAKSEPVWKQVPAKRQDDQSSHQTVKYH